jgi:diguanylate cyclase (GGDEF)-like protein/PAS domain S-box-containing protein
MARSLPIAQSLIQYNTASEDATAENTVQAPLSFDHSEFAPFRHLFRLTLTMLLVSLPTLLLPSLAGWISSVMDAERWKLIHTVIGSGNIAVCVTIFLLGGAAYLRCGTRDFLILSLGFLAVGLFDAGHVLQVAGLFTLATPNQADWWALMATLGAVISLTSAGFCWRSRGTQRLFWRVILTILTISVVAVIYLVVLLTPVRNIVVRMQLTPVNLGGMLTFASLVLLVSAWIRTARASFSFDTAPLSDLTIACWSMTMMVLDEAMSPGRGIAPQFAAHIALLLATFFTARYVFQQGIKAPFERRQANESLRIFKQIVESASNGIILCDAAQTHAPIVYVNRAFESLTGYQLHEVKGRAARFLQGTQQFSDSGEQTREKLAQGVLLQTTLRDHTKNGQAIWLELTVSAIKDTTGKVTHYLAIQNDITARKRAEQEVEQLAFNDEITGLPNRRLFVDRVERAMALTAGGKSFGAVIMVDLDHFRRVNEGRGYASGDALLRQIAERFSETLRAEDTLARLGGDEFGLVLPMLGKDMASTAQAARRVADRLKKSLSKPFLLGELEHYITASFGLTIFPNTAAKAEELFKQADAALFRVKENGRNGCAYYEESMQKVVESQLTLQSALRHALAKHELRVFIQPQVNCDGIWIGGEALLRWQSAQHGMVSPADFIPIAEDTGLILPIGEFVLREVCRLSKWLDDAGHHLRLAVNVSPIQFRSPRFVHRLRAILRITRANPKQLIVEITEGTVLEDVDDSIAKIKALRELGIDVSIDDFGTGYSSLSYLKKLPISELKIDRSFIKDAPKNPNDAALIEAILAVARHHNLHVVAEGVETAEQLEFLRTRGCESYQGFYFAKPMPLDQFSHSVCSSNEASDAPTEAFNVKVVGRAPEVIVGRQAL